MADRAMPCPLWRCAGLAPRVLAESCLVGGVMPSVREVAA